MWMPGTRRGRRWVVGNRALVPTEAICYMLPSLDAGPKGRGINPPHAVVAELVDALA